MREPALLRKTYIPLSPSLSHLPCRSLLVRCVSRFFPSTSKAIDVASVFGPHMSNLYCSLSPPSAVKSHLLPLLLTRGVPGLVDFTLHVLQVYKPSLKSGSGLPPSVDLASVASAVGGRLGKNVRRGRMPSAQWCAAFLQSQGRSPSEGVPSSPAPASLRLDTGARTPGLVKSGSDPCKALESCLPPTHSHRPLVLLYQATEDGYGYEAIEKTVKKMRGDDLVLVVGGHGGERVGVFLKGGFGDGSGESFVLEGAEGHRWKPPSFDDDDKDELVAPSFLTVARDFVQVGGGGTGEGAFRVDKEMTRCWSCPTEMYGNKGLGEFEIAEVEVWGFGEIF